LIALCWTARLSQEPSALVVATDPFLNSRREQLVALAQAKLFRRYITGASSPRPAA
jgi:hypothetical protein